MLGMMNQSRGDDVEFYAASVRPRRQFVDGANRALVDRLARIFSAKAKQKTTVTFLADGRKCVNGKLAGAEATKVALPELVWRRMLIQKRMTRDSLRRRRSDLRHRNSAPRRPNVKWTVKE